MQHRWGSVEVKRDNEPVLVSVTRGDLVAYEMVARWLRMTPEQVAKLVARR